MASILIGAGALAYDQIKKSKEKRVAKIAQYVSPSLISLGSHEPTTFTDYYYYYHQVPPFAPALFIVSLLVHS